MGNKMAAHFPIIFGFLLLGHSSVIPVTTTSITSGKYSRIILESSNNPNLSVSSLSLLSEPKQGKEEESNATWKAKGFSTTNVSLLLSQYPSSFRLPSSSSGSSSSSGPTIDNSNRIFHSSNESAALTIVIKQFRHALMYLNFSYYIATVPEKSVEVLSNLKDLKEEKPIDKDSKIKTDPAKPVSPEKAASTPPVLQKLSVGVAVATEPSGVIKLVPVPLESNPATKSTTTVAPIMTMTEGTAAKSVEEPEPIPIMHDMARKKRSIPDEENVTLFPDPDSTKQPKPSHIEIVSSTAASNNPNMSSPSPTKTDIVDVDHPITFVQAVEMIKAAAEAIKKGAAGPPHIIPSTGSTDPLGNEVPTKTNVVTETGTSKPIKETSGTAAASSASKVDVKNVSLKDTPAEKEKAHNPHRRHKSKLSGGVANNAKSENNKGKGKNSKRGKKTEDNLERISGKTNGDDEEGEKEDEDSSSSSSSSEEEISDRAGGKKKISYKTWKASFEKKNRPPGLYVMVNDDIIFDNWEGLWDKHYVLGRWTGTNSKPLAEGMWNQTQLFMNWEDVPTNDVKITFEWEPMNENAYLVLSDIVVSTIATSSACEAKPEPTALHEVKSLTEENTSAIEKVVMPVVSQLPETPSPSVVIIKQSAENNGAWQIIKMGKAGSTQVENVYYKELKQNQVDNATQTKLAGENVNDDLLKAVLKIIQSNETSLLSSKKAEDSMVSTSTSTTQSTTMLSTLLSTSTPKASTATISTTMTAPSATTTTTNSTPSKTSTIPETTFTITTSTTTTEAPSSSSTTKTSTNDAYQVGNSSTSEPNSTSIKRQRNEDRESALLVSVITGSIALTILVMTIKKYVEVSNKERNQAA